MFRLIVVLILLCALRAEAQPACWPSQVDGTGNSARVEMIAPTTQTPLGMGSVDVLWWMCPRTASQAPRHEVFFCPVNKRVDCLKHVTRLSATALTAAWVAAPPASLDAAKVRWAYDIWASRWGLDEAAAALGGAAAPIWWVPKAPINARVPGHRPTYTFSGPTSIVLDQGTVAELTICACGTARFPAAGDPTHCSVLNSPQKLAICVRKPP